MGLSTRGRGTYDDDKPPVLVLVDRGTGQRYVVPAKTADESTIRLLDALQTEFGEKLCVVLDNASYFAVNKVCEFTEDTPLELCYLSRGSPELNPEEECWHRLSQRLGNQLFEELDEFKTLFSLRSIPSSHQISLPYLYP